MAKTSKVDANNNTEVVVSGLKSFKASAEVENFYRFVHENNLRKEARDLIKFVLTKTKAARKRSRRKSTKVQ